MEIEAGLELFQYFLDLLLDVVVLGSMGNDLPLEDSLDDFVIEAFLIEVSIRVLEGIVEGQQIVHHLRILYLPGRLGSCLHQVEHQLIHDAVLYLTQQHAHLL